MNPKRRRGVGIRKWLIAALKDYAKQQQEILSSQGKSKKLSHTSVFNLILRGQLEPIRDYERYKEGGDDARKGVSMPEDLWLAVKDYGERRGKGESDTKVVCKILVGKIDPIPSESIEEGIRRAREREAVRAKESPQVQSDDSSNEESGSRKSVKKRQKSITDKPIIEVLESSQEEIQSQEEVIIQQREEVTKRSDERGRPLSQGVPVNERPLEKKINPDDDSYGGIFNL